MMVDLISGDEAFSLLADESFGRQWDSLCENCPWATGFQSRAFLTTWYTVYKQAYAPILLIGRSPDEKLTGLLPLAISVGSDKIVVAGAQQAEYQVWLSEATAGESFLTAALQALHRSFPDCDLVFRYLPPSVPVDWLRSARGLRRRCRLDTVSRPLMNLQDAAAIEGSLRKKSNKSRINRLKKLGELRLERLTGPSQLAAVLDEIIDYYDLRMGATQDVLPFREDRLNKAFNLALMDQPDLLHVTVLKAGDRVLAAHLGLCSKHMVHLGIMAHSPFEAKHSPGKLHMLMLAKELAEQDYEAFDLTPGGDAYKERFATTHDQAYALTVFAHTRRRRLDTVCRKVRALARRALGAVRIKPQTVKALVQRLRRVRIARIPLVLMRNLRRKLWHSAEFRFYTFTPEDARDIEYPGIMARDRIADLVQYMPADPWQSRQRFLATALARLEQGLHVRTFAENGRLCHYCWFKVNEEKSFVAEVHQEIQFPPRSVVLVDGYTFPHARGRGLLQASLRQIVHDAGWIPNVDKIYSGVLADNAPSRHVTEKIGFSYAFSCFEKVRFGRSRRWTNLEF